LKFSYQNLYQLSGSALCLVEQFILSHHIVYTTGKTKHRIVDQQQTSHHSNRQLLLAVDCFQSWSGPPCLLKCVHIVRD